LSTQPVVAVVDAYGNTVTSDSSTSVSVSVSAGSLGGTTSVTAASGVVTFSDVTYTGSDSVAATLTYAATGLTSASGSVTASGPGAAATIASNAGDGQSATVGTTVSTAPSVLVTDSAGNAVSGVSVTFAVASGGGSVASSATVTSDSSGVATSPAWTLGTTAGSNTLTATSSGLSGSPVTFTATGTAAAAAQLREVTAPVAGASGAVLSTQPVVRITDFYLNTVTSDSSTQVTVSVSGDATLGGTTTVTAVNGVVTFTDLTLVGAVGTDYTLTFATSVLTSATATVSPSGAGTAASFVISGTGTQAAGASQDLTITAKDSYGNTATGYTGDKSLTFSGASTAPAGQIPTVENKAGSSVTFGTATTIEFSSGVASVSAGANGVMTLYAAETAAVSVTDGSITATTPLTVTVSPDSASASRSELTVSAPSVAAGGSVTMLVTAKDQYGNALTAGGDTVAFTKDSGAGTLGSVVDNGNGTYQATVTAPTVLSSGTSGVFSATINSASVEGGTGSAQTETVSYVPGTAAELVLAGAGTQTAGGSQNLTITAKDQYGNTATSYTGDKSLTFSGASTAPDGTSVPTVTDKTGSAVDFGTATTITFSSGVASVSSGSNGAMVLYAAETAAVSVTDGTISSATPQTVVVSATSVDAGQSTLAASASTATVNSTLTVSVQARDSYGNALSVGGSTVVITQDSGSATVSSVTDNSDGTYSAVVTAPATAGTSTFSATLGGANVEGGTGALQVVTVTYTAVPTPSGGGSGSSAGETEVLPQTPENPLSVDQAVLAGTDPYEVTENGRVVSVIVKPMEGQDGWEALGSNFQVWVSANDPDGIVLPLGARSDLWAYRQGDILVDGTGYRAGSIIRAFLVPRDLPRGGFAPRTAISSVDLGEVIVQPSGSFTHAFTVPGSTPAGDYVLQVNGVTRTVIRSVNMDMRIVAGDPAIEMRGGFFVGRGAQISAIGEKKIEALVNSIPSTASAVTVMVTGASVSYPSGQENRILANRRTEALVKAFEQAGIDATVMHSMMWETANSQVRTAGSRPLPLLRTKGGKPLSTAAISYLSMNAPE